MLYVERKKYMVKKGQVLYNSLKREKYPLPISEYINLLNAMDSEEKDRAEFGDYAATLEDKIVHGKFAVTNNGIIQFLVNEEKKLDFHLSSSTAKSCLG